MMIPVSSTAELLAAIGSAMSGDVVLLNPGVYSNVVLQGVNIPGGVAIASANPGAPATLTGLIVRNSSDLQFSNLEFTVLPQGVENQFAVFNSQNIHFLGLNVHGSLDGNPADDQSGLTLRGSANVSVRGSEFQQLHFGVTMLDSQDVVVADNRFHDIRTDGVRGGGSSNVQIEDNFFTDFYPADGDHPDAIQLWETTLNPTAHDIVISGNVIVRGDGGLMQGVFLRGPNGTFDQVTVSDNTIVGGMTNGIYLDGAANVEISHNVVAGYFGAKSWIRLENTSNAVVMDNDATHYIWGDMLPGLQVIGNDVIGYVSNESMMALEAWGLGDRLVPLPLVDLTASVVEVIAPVQPVAPVAPVPALPDFDGWPIDLSGGRFWFDFY